ncbi:MAG: lectin [Rhizomicrobium sp.]|jgi:hypothetical protein
MPNDIKLRATEIAPGNQWTAGKYRMHFTGTGNFELWDTVSRRLLWHSATRGRNAARMVMQDDGNLVIYDKRGRPLWATGTEGNQSAYLTLQQDGNVVIYSQENRPLWQTATARH